jgi:hypothetical protein
MLTARYWSESQWFGGSNSGKPMSGVAAMRVYVLLHT